MPEEECHREFECVNMVREIRDRISAESAGMTHEGLHDWYRAQRCSVPSFERWLRQRGQERTGVENAVTQSSPAGIVPFTVSMSAHSRDGIMSADID
ncbi:MAG: hypothetical protein OXN96_04455 [Bryobacterales bacterium]|nr:hypothetical protein [Bryobacterales bacterium]MDE0624470.1 hypothetical protein [Bryobacterales bacterium]